MRHLIDEKGFSLIELMFAMTILGIGLLAMASMQIVALQGTTSSRQFSIATNLARETMSMVKMPGVFLESESGIIIDPSPILANSTSENDLDADFYWEELTKETDLAKLSLAANDRPFIFDFIEVLKKGNKKFDRTCYSFDRPMAWPDTCTATNIAEGDYVRIINTRNIPADAADDDDAIMKEINVIILWEERNRTRSVSMVTRVGRKSSAFF